MIAWLTKAGCLPKSGAAYQLEVSNPVADFLEAGFDTKGGNGGTFERQPDDFAPKYVQTTGGHNSRSGDRQS
jgi:hypothetical protein